MNRRTFASIATVAGLGALAGCLDILDDNDIDEDAAADSIDTARSDIQLAIDLLLDTIEDDDLLLDSEQFFGDLEAAEGALDDAEPVATDDQLTSIEELRTFIDYVTLRGEVEEAVDEGFEEHLGAGLDEYWTGRDQYEDVSVSTLQTATDRFEDAEESFEAAESAFEQGESTAGEAQDVLDDVAPDTADSFDDVAYDELVDEIEEVVWAMGEMQPFAAGCAEGSQGWYHASNGFIAFEEDRWDDGEDAFENANASFDSAVGSLETVNEDLLAAMTVFFDEVLCEIGSGPEATDHWIAAAAAAQDDDQQAHEDAVDAGWELITDCHE